MRPLTKPEEGALVHLAVGHDEHNAEDLDQYIRCPRAYLYQRILNLSGARDDGAYVQFHRAVYSVAALDGSRWTPQRSVSGEEAAARLDAAWEETGPSVPIPMRKCTGTLRTVLSSAPLARRASGRGTPGRRLADSSGRKGG